MQEATPEQAAQQVEIREQLADMLRTQARYDEALASLAAMRQAAEVTRDHCALVRAWRASGSIQNLQGALPAARASIAQAEAVASQCGLDAQSEWASVLIEKGMTAYRGGNAKAALILGEQAHDLARDANDPRAVASSLNLLGSAYWLLGNYNQSDHYFRQALVLGQQLGNRRMQLRALHNLGASAYMRGDYLAATELFQDALALAEDIGDRDIRLFCLSNLGGALAGQGKHAAAQSCLQQAIQSAPATGWYGQANTYHFLAQAYLGQGQIDAALESAIKALSLAEEMSAQDLMGRAWRTLGSVVAALGRPVTVFSQTRSPVECFAESQRIFDGLGAAGERARTLRTWALYEMERGNQTQGEKLYREALDIFQRLGLELEVERTLPQARGRK